jgi:hypothetical protein
MAYGSLALDEISTSGNLAIAGNVAVTGTFALGSQALVTPFAGEFEYDGQVPYFTPIGTQRGLIPSAQYFRLNSPLAGANATGAQSVLGVGVTLSANTVYAFEQFCPMSKTAGTTSHNVSFLFGGTATVNTIGYTVMRNTGTSSFTNVVSDPQPWVFKQDMTACLVTGARTTATYYDQTFIKGTVSINAGGTFVPQYQLSAAPGGAYTTAQSSYFLIYPVGAAGSNTSVGTWA